MNKGKEFKFLYVLGGCSTFGEQHRRKLGADESVLMVECSVRRVMSEADPKLERGGWLRVRQNKLHLNTVT